MVCRILGEMTEPRIVQIESMKDIFEASALFDTIWGSTDGSFSHMPPNMMRAIIQAGGYAAATFVGDEMIAAIVGIVGRDDDGMNLHSHILGVLPGHQVRNVGFAMKRDQRAWSLDHGITRVTWTFDPLVRRNAYFNIRKLGADAAKYLVNFYGEMPDAINAGDESDRMYISWELESEAAEGGRPEPDIEALIADGAVAVLSDDRGKPARADATNAPIVLCGVPENIVDVRARDQQLGLAWRYALRETLGTLMNDGGYRVSAFARSGFYVLERP